MTDKKHTYRVTVRWTGNEGCGTASYRSYSRNHEIHAPGKAAISASSDPAFRGDATRWNPEDMLVASLAACHKLWYLGLCAAAGVTVVAYEDDASGVMVEVQGGAGQFESVILRPKVIISADSDPDLAKTLHHKAHEMCFIARSVNFSVEHQPDISRESD
ncbi:OsmC family peroxiredoxin [Affinibrenneria salicis]|uniref:OsmC family peroxiredoxin n=1 Tax=Affinibrenneria salicis TaxID=2590031 RepID=A0A5J5G400_9GAMM|nr:OsmC family protein [Affinibrenneria salicis]KAA9001781.1 OsmC family peroxiredoxin [Affinibrenneria salicis]